MLISIKASKLHACSLYKFIFTHLQSWSVALSQMSFFGILVNVLLKFIFTYSLSTLPSQIRYNLSVQLCWVGRGQGVVKGNQFKPARTDRQHHRVTSRVTSRVAPWEQQGATKNADRKPAKSVEAANAANYQCSQHKLRCVCVWGCAQRCVCMCECVCTCVWVYINEIGCDFLFLFGFCCCRIFFCICQQKKDKMSVLWIFLLSL